MPVSSALGVRGVLLFVLAWTGEHLVRRGGGTAPRGLRAILYNVRITSPSRVFYTFPFPIFLIPKKTREYDKRSRGDDHAGKPGKFYQLSTKMTFLVDALTLSPSAFVKPWIKSLSLNKAFLTNHNWGFFSFSKSFRPGIFLMI